MRDALSAFDQVIAFAGDRITAADVAAVLGLIARDALLDLVEIVADARAADVFTEVGRLVEGGQDLKLVCRELTVLVRDLLVVRIDQARLADPELAPDAARLSALAARFSREDLLRAFDVLAKAEADIRFATQPRHHVEMALLRWMHLGQLQPLTELIAALGGGGAAGGGSPKLPRPAAPPARPSAAVPRPSASMPRPTASGRNIAQSGPVASPSPAPAQEPAPAPNPAPAPLQAPAPAPVQAPVPAPTPIAVAAPVTADGLIEALRKGNRTFFGTALARASFEVVGDRVLITLAGNFEQQRVEARRAWIEETAQQVFGRTLRLDTRVVVAASDVEGAAAQSAQQRLREQAMQSEAVQAMLDVFPAEIRDVEEIRDAE
jgi:DNA polymerase III subunit gamma/tau